MTDLSFIHDNLLKNLDTSILCVGEQLLAIAKKCMLNLTKEYSRLNHMEKSDRLNFHFLIMHVCLTSVLSAICSTRFFN